MCLAGSFLAVVVVAAVEVRCWHPNLVATALAHIPLYVLVGLWEEQRGDIEMQTNK